MTRPFCRYHNFWLCDLGLDFWPTFEKNLTLAITFEPKQIELSYFTFVFLVARPFYQYQNFLTSRPWPWLLTYFWKQLNLGNNIWTKRDTVFIFHICFSCGQAFLLVIMFFLPRDLDLDFSPPFFFWKKNLTLAITFWPKVKGLQYYTYLFPWTKTFCWNQYFWPSGLDFDFDLLLEKIELVVAGVLVPLGQTLI